MVSKSSETSVHVLVCLCVDFCPETKGTVGKCFHSHPIIHQEMKLLMGED